MECPVCYEDCHKTCKLVCGHDICMSCVKEWWVKSEGSPTCPMCRQNLYFRGMRHLVSRWMEEVDESSEYDEEEWDQMCTFLLELKQEFRMKFVKLIEPIHEVVEQFPTVLIYNEFPNTWFPSPKCSLNRYRRRKGFRGDRTNWLEE